MDRQPRRVPSRCARLAEHAPRWVHGNAAKYGGFFSPTGTSYKEPPIGASLMESPPNLTKPSLTKPNQTKPSQAKPSLAGGGGVAGLADLSFLALASDRIPDVARQAKAIDKNFQSSFQTSTKFSNSLGFAWRLGRVSSPRSSKSSSGSSNRQSP